MFGKAHPGCCWRMDCGRGKWLQEEGDVAGLDWRVAMRWREMIAFWSDSSWEMESMGLDEWFGEAAEGSE